MKKPIPKYGCEGGYNADAEGQPHANKRPFTHASTGRDNWRRAVRKRQRREARMGIHTENNNAK